MDFNHELVFHFQLAKAFLDGQIDYPRFEKNFLLNWNEFNNKYEFNIPENDKVFKLLEIRDRIFVCLDCCTRKIMPNRSYGEISVDEFKNKLQDFYNEFLGVKYFFLSKVS